MDTDSIALIRPLDLPRGEFAAEVQTIRDWLPN